MPSILTLESKKYLIKIDKFEGPLDLLIYLIEKNKTLVSTHEVRNGWN